MASYNVIGLMSGTSLDGVDLAMCRFEKKGRYWSYEILNTETYAYSQKWYDMLSNVHELPNRILNDLDRELGIHFAQLIENFANTHQLVPDFVSSHGHTALHQPEKGVTLQLGNGDVMSELLKIPVINDFRKKDVSLGGQGAPLVPIGDRLLFSKFGACLNLGGFSNISYEDGAERIAFDICPVNMALNEIASRTGKSYDEDGLIARAGDVHERLLKSLNSLDYYEETPPKSLGREWYLGSFKKRMDAKRISPVDLLATVTEHIAIQLANAIEKLDVNDIFITGGGAYNKYLIERLSQHCSKDLHIPDNQLIEYKEALIFGFLGVLRMRNETNVLKSVTGATQDHCSGVIHKP